MAFAFPLNLPARWVFRVTGSETRTCAAAGKRWATIAALLTTLCVLPMFWCTSASLRLLGVQAVVGFCLGLFFVDAFFFGRSIPFITPRMPGRTNFALFLTLYLGVLTPFLIGVVYLELHMECHLWNLGLLCMTVFAVHVGVNLLHRKPMEIEEEMEGYDGEFQVLGLS